MFERNWNLQSVQQKQDKKYNINVAALEEAQPEPLKRLQRLMQNLGATWIPAHYIEDFLVEVFDTPREYFNGNRYECYLY